jgi:hypothetical protein
VPSGDRLGDARLGQRLVAPAPPDDRNGVFLSEHRSVALRRVRRRRARVAAGGGPPRRHVRRRLPRAVHPARLDALVPDVRSQPAGPGRRGGGVGQGPRGARRGRAAGRAPRLRLRGPGRARELAAGAHGVALQPARLVRQRRRVLLKAPARHGLLGPGRAGSAGGAAARRRLAGGGARGQARPAAVPRLPDDLDDPDVRRGPARRDLVREARPLDHGHAPVRARVQRGGRPAVAGAHRLPSLPRARAALLRAGPRPPGRAQRRGRDGDAARHPRGDGPAGRRRAGLAPRRMRTRTRPHDARPDRRRTRLHRHRGEDGRAGAARAVAGPAGQGPDLPGRAGGREAGAAQRPGFAGAGRGPPAAGHRHQGGRGDPAILRPPTAASRPRASTRSSGSPGSAARTWPPSTRANRSASPTPRPRRCP